MKFLMLIKHSESYRNEVPPQALMDAMGEFVGGYAMVEVASREEAMRTARQFMELHRLHWPEFEGECEVRQLEDM